MKESRPVICRECNNLIKEEFYVLEGESAQQKSMD